jgi:hypothetical protein
MISLRPPQKGRVGRVFSNPALLSPYLLHGPPRGFFKTRSQSGPIPCQSSLGGQGSSRAISAGALSSRGTRTIPERKGTARGNTPLPIEIIARGAGDVLTKAKKLVSAREMVRASGRGETGRRDFSRVRITLAGTSLTRLKSGLPAHQLASAYKKGRHSSGFRMLGEAFRIVGWASPTIPGQTWRGVSYRRVGIAHHPRPNLARRFVS